MIVKLSQSIIYSQEKESVHLSRGKIVLLIETNNRQIWFQNVQKCVMFCKSATLAFHPTLLFMSRSPAGVCHYWKIDRD